ncbi:hypothetical protein VP01_3047g1 [Puccinia sorghi]|uniref:Uncharacterized protein n=1 Tax=Puccinia sorghi TaxID=27349 RepID=A0A0L6V0P6_9BASI|nr:hypothetical protein VP01_3047g1 [Puccinia sorghi]
MSHEVKQRENLMGEERRNMYLRANGIFVDIATAVIRRPTKCFLEHRGVSAKRGLTEEDVSGADDLILEPHMKNRRRFNSNNIEHPLTSHQSGTHPVQAFLTRCFLEPSGLHHKRFLVPCVTDFGSRNRLLLLRQICKHPLRSIGHRQAVVDQTGSESTWEPNALEPLLALRGFTGSLERESCECRRKKKYTSRCKYIQAICRCQYVEVFSHNSYCFHRMKLGPKKKKLSTANRSMLKKKPHNSMDIMQITQDELAESRILEHSIFSELPKFSLRSLQPFVLKLNLVCISDCLLSFIQVCLISKSSLKASNPLRSVSYSSLCLILFVSHPISSLSLGLPVSIVVTTTPACLLTIIQTPKTESLISLPKRLQL